MNEIVHVVCPHCDRVNRLPDARLTESPKCGHCHRALFEAHPLALRGSNFRVHAERSDIPLLVDFWASWCGPCQTMAPQFEQAAAELEPNVRLAKLNTEEEPNLATEFGIRSIPTLVLLRGGREIARQTGAIGRSEIIGWVRRHI